MLIHAHCCRSLLQAGHFGFAKWRVLYVAFMSVNCGDTLASELGMLSSQRPVLITSGAPVAPGQDGGVTVWGTAAAALGGALIGAFDATTASVATCVMWAVVGSTVDSIMGSVYQARSLRLSHAEWKARNSTVNAMSSLAIAVAAGLAEELPSVVFPIGVLVVVVAFVIPLVPLLRGPRDA